MRADVEVRADLKEGSFAKARAAKEAIEDDINFGVRSREGGGLFVPTAMRIFEDFGGDPGQRAFTRSMRGLAGIDPDFLANTIDPMFGRDGGRSPSVDIDRIGKSFRNFGRTLVKYRPSIMDWWNVLALIIPVMITLAGAAVGLIAAFSGVAIAAAGIVGIGLLGWGDSAQESFKNLRREARALGSELFDVMRPVSAEMQPLLAGAMDALPGQVARLRDELMGLSDFSGGLGSIGRGFVDWVEKSLQIINKWREEIVHIAEVGGSALGSFIQDFLVFGLKELIKNQEAYEKLGRIFVDFFRILFELAKAVTFVVAQFDFIFTAGKKLFAALSNKWTVALFTFLTTVWAVTTALTSLGAIKTWILGLSVAQTIAIWAKAYWGLVQAVMAGNASLRTMRSLLLTTGVGALAVGAGLLLSEMAFNSVSGNAARSGGTQVNNINIQGDVGRREMHQVKDYFGPQWSTNMKEKSIQTGPR